MKQAGLREDFDGQRPDARLAWFCPPARWSLHDSRLIIYPEAQTDYWQRTHYGFSADNGHFLGLPLTGDFLLSTRVRSLPAHQYDQAGLMVRYSPDCWLKVLLRQECGGTSNGSGRVRGNDGRGTARRGIGPRRVDQLFAEAAAFGCSRASW